MFIRKLIIPLIIIIFLTHPCFPQQKNSITLEGIELKLGMDKNEVTNLFNKINYELKQLRSNNNEYGIITKNGPPFRAIGTVRFENGKLCYIEKMWGQFGRNDLIKFGNTLNNLISKLNEKGELFAIVKSDKGAREPSIVSNSINLYFGNHQISIIISESNIYGNNISIFESLTK